MFDWLDALGASDGSVADYAAADAAGAAASDAGTAADASTAADAASTADTGSSIMTGSGSGDPAWLTSMGDSSYGVSGNLSNNDYAALLGTPASGGSTADMFGPTAWGSAYDQADLGSGLGSGLSGASSSLTGNDYLDKLISQVGKKLFNKDDPLSSATKLVGALGLLKNITTGKQDQGVDMSAPANLINSNKSPYAGAATIVPKQMPVARNPASFIAPAGALQLVRKV